MGDAVRGNACKDVLRITELVVQTDESLPVCIESVHRSVHAIERIVVTALLVFCLMIDNRTIHLNLSGREVSLEVLHIGSCIPKAPLRKRPKLEAFCFRRGIAEGHLLNLTPCMKRDEEEDACLKTILRTCNARIAHSMAALIEIKRSLAWLPSRRPYCTVVIDIEISSAVVHRDSVITVSCDSAELSVLVERISTGSIGNQREEVLVTEVVYPRPRGLGVCDDIFAGSVIKMSEYLFH